MKGLTRIYSCVTIQDEDLEEAIESEKELKQGEKIDDNVRRHLPPGSGPFSVGCVDLMNNSTLDGSFFRLFYPVDKTDILQRNTQWPLWLPRKEYGFGYAYFLKKTKLFGKFLNWLGGDVYIPALWQAPLTDRQDKFPIIILSHGIGGNRTTYSTFCCELASQGYLVAVPEHRDGSASMTYVLQDNARRNIVELIKDQDGGKHKRQSMHRSQSFKEEWRSFEHTDPMGIEWDDYNYRNSQVQKRAAECSRLLDVFIDINNGTSVRNFLGFHFSLKQFKGRIDMSKVAMAGHSFGGSTCVAVLATDKRFRAGVMLDAWMHPLNAEICQGVTQPLLLINYELFQNQWKKNIQQMKWLESTTCPRCLITLKGACHQAISDFQFLVSRTFGRLMEVRSELSPTIAMDVNRKATLAFLSQHLGIEYSERQEGDKILQGLHDHVILGSGMEESS